MNSAVCKYNYSNNYKSSIYFTGKDTQKAIKRLSNTGYSNGEIEEVLSYVYDYFSKNSEKYREFYSGQENCLEHNLPLDYAGFSRLGVNTSTYENSRNYVKNLIKSFFDEEIDFYTLFEETRAMLSETGTIDDDYINSFFERFPTREDFFMSDEEKEEFKSMVRLFFSEGEYEDFKDFIDNSGFEFLRFFSSSTKDEYLELMLEIYPESSELSKNKNGFINFLLLSSAIQSGFNIQNELDKINHEETRQAIINNILSFKYQKIDKQSLSEDRKDVNQSFNQYLSHIKEFYAVKFSKEDSDKLLSLFKSSDSEAASKLISEISGIKVDKQFALDIWTSFIKESFLTFNTPVSKNIAGEDIYCYGFENVAPLNMNPRLMKGQNMQSLFEAGFFIDTALEVINENNLPKSKLMQKGRENLSMLEEHRLSEEIAKMYKDNREFFAAFNQHLDSNIDMQNQIRKIYGLYRALDEKVSESFNYKNYDIPKISFSKHGLLRLISRNLINPKHETLGYVDFDSLLNSLEAGFIKSKGQNFTIPELGGYSGLKVVVNNNQVTTIF